MMNNNAKRKRPAASGAKTISFPARVLRWLWPADHRYIVIRIALVIGLILYTWQVVGANAAKNVPFDEIERVMAASNGLEALELRDANTFQDIFGLAPDGCEGWLLYANDDMMDVTEMMIAKSSDTGVLDQLEAAVNGRIDAQLGIFRSYGPDQTALLERAALWQRGNYLFYGVSDNVDQWEDSFLSIIR